jgi:hypothetical protein
MYFPRIRCNTFLHVFAALVLSSALATAAIPGLCNTGLATGCASLIVPGNGTTTDGNWQIANPSPTEPSSAPIPNPCDLNCLLLVFEPAWVDTPDPSWEADPVTFSATASQWITPQVENNLGGQYIYETSFPVPTADAHVTISGELLSDNEVYAIYISSGTSECIPVAGYPYDNAAVNSPSNFIPPATAFTITKAPVTPGGTATLYFVVRNRGAGGIDTSPTSTGLRVNFSSKSAFSK